MHLQGNFENNLAQAFNLINTGKIDQAINLFESLTIRYPKTARAFHLKAFAYTKDNNFEKALESIKEAKKISPDNLDINLDYANILNATGAKDDAIRILEFAKINNKRDSRVYYNLSCLHIDLEQHEEAIKNLKKTLELDPKNKQASFNLGVCFFNIQNFDNTIKVFQAYQKEFGFNFEAERYLSIAFYSLNKLEEAQKSLEMLCSEKPQDSSVWYDRAIILENLNRNIDAIHCYLKTLEIVPDFHDAFTRLASVYKKEGKIHELIEVYETCKYDENDDHIRLSFLAQAYLMDEKTNKAFEAINSAINHYFNRHNIKDKTYIDYLVIKGNIYFSIGELENSINIYKDVLEINEKSELAYINIGNAYVNLSKPKEGINYLKKAIKLNPKIASAYTLLGNAYYMLGNKEKALAYFDEAEKLDPSLSGALSSKAAAYMDSGNSEEAISALIKAIQKDPYNSNAYVNLGVLLRDKRLPEEAGKWLKRGITILKSQPYKDKKLASALANLGYTYLDLEKYTDMKDCFEQALKYDENCPAVAGFLVYAKLFVGDWKNLAHHKKLTLKKISENKNSCTPFCSFSVTDELEAQKKVAINYAKSRAEKVHKGKVYNYNNNYNHIIPRIAYISNDFHDHATMHLMAGLFENQNNENFDYHAISYTKKGDANPITKRVEKAIKNFHHVNEFSDEQIAELINQLEIDIAVDLKGYTYGSRMDILAHRPAPIQISYLGHPGTTGTEYIDYAIVDNFIVPDENDKFFTEKLIKLQGCYQPNDDKRTIPNPLPRKNFGLPENKFIFCSFNNTYKIQPKMFSVWMDILKSKEDSILWLLETEDIAKTNLLTMAKNKGIDESRIFFSERILITDHIQRQMCADLFLDTFPICAHTTASDALWVGVPIVTMAGKSMVSRVAGSTLKNIGMEELITYNFEDYKNKALYLANNPNYLKKIKNKIIANRFSSKLFDIKSFTKNLEDEYEKLFLNFKNKK